MSPVRQFVLVSCLLIIFSCKQSDQDVGSLFGSSDLVLANNKLLSIAMEDGFPPPIASRVYVYPHIAHYMALRGFYPDSLTDISSKLKGLNAYATPNAGGAHPELASLLAFCNVAKKVVFSEHLIDELRQTILEKAKKAGVSNKTMDESSIYAEKVSSQIIKWLSEDNYTQTRTMDRWTSSKNPGEWRETPPDYQAGLEPHWGKMRPLLIDSAGFYKSTPLPKYSPDKNSDFFKMVERTYLISKSMDSTKTAIAWYWDDNPNTSEHRGHLVTIIHKISPPGHWLGIISGIVTKEKSSLFESSKAFTFTAIAMFDGIISCWYEKYKTNLVRPVSYIQEYIDVKWKPLIQTPPFPEYTSGHSVISASAAAVLNTIYGADYSFVDSTQLLFGMAPRPFKSFDAAAWEVSLSRFYGGIHYYNGIEEGNKQGKMIGNLVVKKLNQ